MPLSTKTKDVLSNDCERIRKIVDKMVERIRKEDPHLAQWSESYWAAHIKGSLGANYGGLGKVIE